MDKTSSNTKKTRKRPIRLTGDQEVAITVFKEYRFVPRTRFSNEIYEIADRIYEKAQKQH